MYQALSSDAFNNLVLSTCRDILGYETFNCESWDSVRPVLREPRVLTDLKLGMANLCKECGLPWDPDKGPWFYSPSPWRWVPGLQSQWMTFLSLSGADVSSSEAYQAWLVKHNAERFAWLGAHRPPAPERDSLRWYQVFGGCFAMMAWQCSVAECMWPSHAWKIYTCTEPDSGLQHAVILGWPRPKSNGCIKVFDLLWEPYDPDLLKFFAKSAVQSMVANCVAARTTPPKLTNTRRRHARTSA